MSCDPYITYRLAWERRRREAEQSRRERIRVARQTAEICSRLLVDRFGARKVYLFGSLASGRMPHERSDIDLAVEGLAPGGVYWRALAELWKCLPPGIQLDLVPIEDAEPGLAERIFKEGELLHGK